MAAPSGQKHRGCVMHVKHPYPKNGWLCVSDPLGADAAAEFADYLLAVAVRHREVEEQRRLLREPLSAAWLTS
ncbi:MAG: hypothetical protein ACOYB2_10740 [Limnohabitans sp.]